jgi:hypothetical protein
MGDEFKRSPSSFSHVPFWESKSQQGALKIMIHKNILWWDWTQWHIPVIPAMWEAAIERPHLNQQPGHGGAHLTPQAMQKA